jgi:hypothetical protein
VKIQQFFLLAVLLALAGCSSKPEPPPVPAPTRIDRTVVQRWTVVDVRSNRQYTQEIQSRVPGAIAGTIAGAGIAYLSKATPLGMAAGAAVGGATGSTLPRDTKSLEKVYCLIMLAKPDGTKWSHMFIDNEDDHQAIKCSLARIGDTYVMTQVLSRWSDSTQESITHNNWDLESPVSPAKK